MKVVRFLRGFTQVELLMSMGILMVLIAVLTSLFGQIVDVQLESKSLSSVDENGRYILARMIHDMQSASSIKLPATPGGQANTLQITVNAVDYTYALDANGNLLLTDNTGSNNLNSEAGAISNLNFKRIGSGDANDTVQVNFTVTSRTQRSAGTDAKNFQTTLGLQ